MHNAKFLPPKMKAALRLGIAVSAALVLAACGSTRTITRTVTHTLTVRETTTVTVAPHVKAPVAAAKKRTPKPLTGSGNGTQQIELTIAAPSTIKWTCADCSFFDMSGLSQNAASAIDISSTASSGESTLAAGAYSTVTISSDGDWTIRITADAP